jgi:hypothetical protein
MSPQCGKWHTIAAVIVSVVLVHAPVDLRAQSLASGFRVYIEDGQVRQAAQRALEDASVLLEDAKCQRVLAEFTDSGRQPLAARLAALDVSAQAYLRLLIVQDGQRHARCEQPDILAFTTPGSRVIFLCGQAFVRLSRRHPEEARATIIHEVLHSLGLGENPPTSRFITHRVQELCW